MIKIHTEPIILSETVEMLFKFVNGFTFETLKSDFIRKYASKRDDQYKNTVYETAGMLTKIMTDVCFDLDQKNPQLQYYFGGYTYASMSGKCCLAQIMTWLLRAYDADFDTHVCNLKETWHLKIETKDSIMLAPGISFQYEDDALFPANFIEQIDALQYPEEFRWRLFKFISNPEFYIDELADLIRPIAERLSVQLKTHINDIMGVYGYWNEYFKDHSCSDFILNFGQVEVDFPENQDMHVYVSLMNSVSVITEIDTDRAQSWYVHVGCLLDDGISHGTKQFMTDEICDTLRVLSDKSKFLILKTIKDSPAYGMELAERLGLTNATISRHMNTLYNCGFIVAEKENAKVFYRTNTENIEKFLRSLNDELLK